MQSAPSPVGLRDPICKSYIGGALTVICFALGVRSVSLGRLSRASQYQGPNAQDTFLPQSMSPMQKSFDELQRWRAIGIRSAHPVATGSSTCATRAMFGS